MKNEDFNQKFFLLPGSITSMAAVHIKVYNNPQRKEYQMRISDCNNAIKLWGGISTYDELEDGIQKLSNLIDAASILKKQLVSLQQGLLQQKL